MHVVSLSWQGGAGKQTRIRRQGEVRQQGWSGEVLWQGREEGEGQPSQSWSQTTTDWAASLRAVERQGPCARPLRWAEKAHTWPGTGHGRLQGAAPSKSIRRAS